MVGYIITIIDIIHLIFNLDLKFAKHNSFWLNFFVAVAKQDSQFFTIYWENIYLFIIPRKDAKLQHLFIRELF